MQKRPPYHWAILVACAAAISLAALVTPKIGRCGSALYLLSRILAGQALLATGISAIQTQAIGLLVATLINAVAFLVPAVVWYYNAPRNRYVSGLFIWTVLYLAAYFFLFPTRDCP
jgi:hypothetical protein